MKNINLFCEHYGFDSEAAASLDGAYRKLAASPDAFSVFQEQIAICSSELLFDHVPVFEALHSLSDATGLHPHTIDLLYLLALMPMLKQRYKDEGIPLEYFDGFAGNLKAIAENSFAKNNVCGTTTGWWLIDFFKLKLFTIGRLQFKRRKFKRVMAGGDLRFEPGQYYIDVHIPGGGSLTPEVCHSAYAEAARFFRQRFGMTDPVFCCFSWVMSPDLDEFLPPHSNILKFAHDYTILETHIDPKSQGVVFIFDTNEVPEDIDTLPGDTSLRRAFKERLKAGKTINTAFGAMRYPCQES